MFRSIRTRIIAATAACLAIALLLNTVINYQVTQHNNQRSQQEIITSAQASHGMAIADWASSKLAMIASLQSAALSADPVPVLSQIARADLLTFMSATPAIRQNSPMLTAFLRITIRQSARGISRRQKITLLSSRHPMLMPEPVSWW